jgi:hypothetical protein
MALDSDPAVAGTTWRRAAASDLKVTVGVADLAMPTPALGWNNQESASLLERLDKRFDMVLALAVVHHLLVTGGIPLDEIVDLLARLTRDGAVVEYVGPDDSNFRRLSRGREGLYDWLTPEVFAQALNRCFSIIAQKSINDNRRVLYDLRIRRTS